MLAWHIHPLYIYDGFRRARRLWTRRLPNTTVFNFVSYCYSGRSKLFTTLNGFGDCPKQLVTFPPRSTITFSRFPPRILYYYCHEYYLHVYHIIMRMFYPYAMITRIPEHVASPHDRRVQESPAAIRYVTNVSPAPRSL